MEKRLNPFSFPYETNTRFLILIITVFILSVTGYRGALSGFQIVLFQLSGRPVTEQSMQEAFSFFTPDLALLDGVNTALDEENTSAAYDSSMVLMLDVLRKLLFPILFGLLTLFLASIYYRTHPIRIRKRKNLTILRDDEEPVLQKSIHTLALQAARVPDPQIELGPGLKSVDAQAFGFRGKSNLGLGGGTRLLLAKKPAAFKALIMHELAHIANGDVWRTYFAVSVWPTYLILIAIPNTLFFVWFYLMGLPVEIGGLSSGLGMYLLPIIRLFIFGLIPFQFVMSLVILRLILASLLRMREYYADQRVAAWGGGQTWSELLEQNPMEKEPERMKKWFRLHPTISSRLRLIRNPIDLFRSSPELALFSGVLSGLVLSAFPTFFNGFMVAIGSISAAFSLALINLLRYFNRQENILALLIGLVLLLIVVALSYLIQVVTIIFPLIPLIVAGYLLAGTVGVQIGRESVAKQVDPSKIRTTSLKLLKLAVFVALGFELGILLLPYSQLSIVNNLIAGNLQLSPMRLLFFIFWDFAFIIAAWFIFIYVEYSARHILGRSTGKGFPARRQKILSAIFVLLFSGAFYPLYWVRIRSLNLFPEAEDLENIVAIIGIVLAASLFLIFFVGTPILVRLWNTLRKPRCHACKMEVSSSILIGEICIQCGQELTPWLFSTIQLQAAGQS